MSDIEILARAYMKAMDIDYEHANLLAREAWREKDVFNAAVIWAQQGVYLKTLKIEGYSPYILHTQLTPPMRPSGIFSSLVRLRRNKKATLTYLNRDWHKILQHDSTTAKKLKEK